MNYIEKINEIVDNISFEDPVFSIKVSDSYIALDGGEWFSDSQNKDFYHQLVDFFARRSFNGETKEFYINKSPLINRIEREVIEKSLHLFTKCSPAKKPRRTKAYKSFKTLLRENKNKIDFTNSVFDIAEYYHTITKTESIINKNNDVHRKNIYQLLCLMERNYGRKSKENSNG